MALAQLSEMELVCLALDRDGDINIVDRLIWGNPGLKRSLTRPHPDFSLMNAAQRAVAVFAAFQGQVLNGGVSQYLFNCPDQISMLIESLPIMEWPAFSTEVRGVFAELDEAMIAKLVNARNVWDKPGEFKDRWSAFRTWANTFDDAAFNRWFYEHDAEFVRRLMQLVWRRRSDLITGVPGLP